MRRTILLLLSIVACVCFLKAQDNNLNGAIEKEILQLEEVQDRAIMQNDADTLDHIYARDFAYLNQYGELIPREKVLAGFRSAKAKFSTPMKHDDIQIRVYGNTVVLTGRSTGTFHYNDKVSDGPRRFTNVYVKLDGRWQLVAHQSTNVAKE
jgi:uncharacterized protein (TIGR02246 family)